MAGRLGLYEGYFDNSLQYQQNSDEEEYCGWYRFGGLAGRG